MLAMVNVYGMLDKSKPTAHATYSSKVVAIKRKCHKLVLCLLSLWSIARA
jgi:hypothetical protein